jgi:transcriptional regulator with XRE-family HTH domain/tetratricopeptide (TPR) repeat protein
VQGEGPNVNDDLAIDGRVVRALRLRRGLSLAVVAGQIPTPRGARTTTGSRTASWLSDVESGKIRLTQLGDIVRLSRVLNVPVEALCKGTGIHSEEVASLSPVPALSGLELPWTTEGAMSALQTIIDDGDEMAIDRRGFIAVSAGVLAGVAHQMVVTPAVRDVSQTKGRMQVTDRSVDSIERLTVHLRDMDNQLGGPRVTYREPLILVQEMLADGTYTDQVGRRLHGAAAALLRLCGWVAYDSDQLAVAQRRWQAALRASKTAGDTAMGAHILASMAGQAIKEGDPRSALSMAEGAQEHYAGDSPRVKVRLGLQAAKCYAATGDALRCRRTLDEAESLVSRLNEPGPDWASWIDAGVVASDVGGCYSQLGDGPKAIESIQRGLALHQGYPRDEALFQVHLATAAISQRRPTLDLALEAANSAAHLLETTVVSPRCVGELRKFAVLVGPRPKNPEARQTVERIRALAAA